MPTRTPRWHAAAVALLAGLLASASLAPRLAAQPETQQPTPLNVQTETDESGQQFIVMAVEEGQGVPIVDFIKMAEQVTKKVFTYSKLEIANSQDANITFVGNKRIKKENFFPFFQTMLYIKGFATLIRGDEDTEVIEVVVIQGPKRTELSSSARYVGTDELERYANQTGVPILTSIALDHIPATVATNQLRPFFATGGGGSGGALTLGVAGKAVLLQGFGPQVWGAYQVIKLVDVETEIPEQKTRVHRLRHAAAEELEPILTEILESRFRATQSAQQQQAGASGAALNVGRNQQIKIVPHSTLNALLLAGTEEQITDAQVLIAELDVPLDATDGDTHVIRLKNVLADDLFRTLRQFIQDDLQAERQAQQGQGRGAQARQPRRTVIVAHQESNSLLVSGTATKFKQLQRMVDDLDRRQPQVLIECAVIELTSQASQRLGIELGLVDIGGDEFTRPFGFTSFGLTQFDDQDGDGIPDTRLPDFANPLQGFTGGIISSDDFAIPVVVNALASDANANILSLPSVVVNNNETAIVRNEEERPQQVVTQGNATTQGGAGTPRRAGITLNISPSISSNNYLRLNIGLTVSRFTTPFDPNAVTAGVVAEREISTQVTMPSGHTMVLGGVIEDAQDDSSSGIPILKDIPILGWLFQSWSTNRNKTNLYFFVTPHILDEEDFSDLAEQSFRKKLEAAEYIGHRRIQLIDRKWRAATPQTLEDPGATIEDIDARGGFDIPIYLRPERSVERGPTGPELPDGEPR